MDQGKLNKILKNHELWVTTNGLKGKKADLSKKDLSWADLSGAELTDVSLYWSNLTGADLSGANLTKADLSRADLSYADLSEANLLDANLDFSSFPLCTGGLNVHIDDKQAIQLLFFLIKNILNSKNTSQEMKNLFRVRNIVKKANEFHRAKEFGIIKL